MKTLISFKAAFIMLISSGSIASAQFPDGNQPVCYMMQQGFSIGSTYRSDAELLECIRTENGAIWKVAEDKRPMSCMYNNNYYSPGALLDTASGNKTMACQTTGNWQPVTDAKE